MDYSDSNIDLVINKLTKKQYDDALSSGLIEDTQLYFVTDDGVQRGDPRYLLQPVQLNLSSIDVDGTQIDALTCQVSDFMISYISVANDDYPIVVYLPLSSEYNYARDFCVRVECLSSAPTIAFFGSNAESCDFESSDDSWATLETGANLFNFTETKRSQA